MKRALGLALSLVAVLLFAAWWRYPSAKASAPNIVLVVVDTLGARHLGVYGECAGCSPSIDRLASNGVVFRRAFATAPWTKPSIASIFTGMYARGHGVQGFPDKLPDSARTIAEWLSERGYDTAGVISQGLIDERNGYAQGFDVYESVTNGRSLHDAITSAQVTDRALEWIDRRDSRTPFFLFVHYFDPHSNYRHHGQFDRTDGYRGPLAENMSLRKLRKLLKTMTDADVAFLRDLYREEIGFTDQQVARLVDGLQKSDPDSKTLMILTADHGEEFREHSYLGHGRSLYDELINVPLVIVPPEGGGGRIVESPVSIIDILPTIADMIGGETLPVDGTSLAPLLRSAHDEAPGRLIFSEVNQGHTRQAAVIRDTVKLVVEPKAKEYRLYDLAKDPRELEPRAVDANDPIAKGLQEALDSHLAQEASAGEQVSHTAEEVRQLKTLGYLQ